jgi:drug/metabolite transporter (DMT)-like permease
MRGGASEEESSGNNKSSILDGRGLLCLVALLYGTLNVSLRLVYQLPDPPTASALSATRGWLSSLFFVPLLVSNRTKQPSNIEESTSSSSIWSWSSPLLWAGLELAIWNFLAQGLLNVGLLSTGSARASFLTQTSVLFTPIISLVSGQSVPSTVWIGCAIALVGLTLLSGGGAGAGSMALAFSTGDWLVLGGALSWSFYLFRLSKIGSKFNEINLQAIKSTIVAVLYSVWFGYSLWKNPAMSFGWVTHLAAWGALFYSAFGPGTVADVLQQKGQKDVSASEANVILSMEPVFAALCAWLLLGEVTSLQETLGGGLILVAALVATR